MDGAPPGGEGFAIKRTESLLDQFHVWNFFSNRPVASTITSQYSLGHFFTLRWLAAERFETLPGEFIRGGSY